MNGGTPVICPKCKSEYEEGYTQCSDCGSDLVPYQAPLIPRKIITTKGISLLKFGLALLFLVIFEFILVTIAYEFYFVYRMKNGGISGSVISNVHPSIWILMTVEFIISISITVWGIRTRKVDLEG